MRGCRQRERCNIEHYTLPLTRRNTTEAASSVTFAMYLDLTADPHSAAGAWHPVSSKVCLVDVDRDAVLRQRWSASLVHPVPFTPSRCPIYSGCVVPGRSGRVLDQVVVRSHFVAEVHSPTCNTRTQTEGVFPSFRGLNTISHNSLASPTVYASSTPSIPASSPPPIVSS